MQDKQNDNILVSIIIITYNHEKYIAQALDSVLMQEVDFKYEIIIGEDCSTDNTRQILLDYKEKYPDKIRLVLHDKNVGMLQNWKSITEISKSKYNALLDGDDYWIDPKKLQIQIDLMEQYPECYLSFHPAEERFGNDKHGKITCKHADGNKIFSISEIILGGGGFCPTASIIIRKEVITDLPDFYYDASVPDFLFQIFGSLNGGALYFDRVMAVYRRDVGVSWSTSMMKDIEKREAFYNKYIDSMERLNIYLDNKYNKEIIEMKSVQHYQFAVSCLYSNLNEEFKKYIELSHRTHPLNSLYYMIDYHLRSFPKLIKILKKLKHSLKV